MVCQGIAIPPKYYLSECEPETHASDWLLGAIKRARHMATEKGRCYQLPPEL